MDAASILLVLAAAGQTNWTPERYPAPPPASSAAAPNDRYGPPPDVADRAPHSVNEPAAALQKGFEAGVQSAQQQVQGWTNEVGSQIQSAGTSARTAGEQALGAAASQLQQITSPFGTSATAPAATRRSRGNVTPPPWDRAAAELEVAWALEANAGNEFVDHTRSAGMIPTRTETGWTTIGTDVAAPPLLVPRLAQSSNVSSAPAAQPAAPVPSSGAASGPNFPTASVGREPVPNTGRQSTRQPPPPPSAEVNHWSTGWADYDAPPATIGRAESNVAANNPLPAETALAPSHTPLQQESPAPASSPPSNAWRDLWADQPSTHEPAGSAPVIASQPQPTTQPMPPRTEPAEPASNVVVFGNAPNTHAAPAEIAPATITAAPPSAGLEPIAHAPTNPHLSAGLVQPSVTMPSAASAAARPGEEQTPWLPLLAVSLALAGSVGANLFLGWSYLDARQKYSSLARKTADKFRRAGRSAGPHEAS